jgi:hypothetical protein
MTPCEEPHLCEVPTMKTAPIVKVFETPEGWHVGIRGGHYADEKTKEVAIEDATHLAEETNAGEIDIYNLKGEMIERRPVLKSARILRQRRALPVGRQRAWR